MDELCPLCLKMGLNTRIIAVQINLDEAVWLCENEKCVWPFGFEELSFISRKVGERRSNEWEIYKKVQKYAGPVAVSTELSLYTPPVTPSSDNTLKETEKSDALSNNISEKISSLGSLHFEKPVVPESTKISNTDDQIAQWMTTTEPTVQPIPSVTSIFDIDGDVLQPKKIITVKSCPKLKECNSIEATLTSDTVKLGASDSSKSTVLQTSEKTQSLSKTEEQSTKNNISNNTEPQIIKQENLSNVKKTNDKECIKIEKSELPKELETKNAGFSENLTEEQKNITTIQVDGSFPITFSYNEADLEVLKKLETKDSNCTKKSENPCIVDAQVNEFESIAFSDNVAEFKKSIDAIVTSTPQKNTANLRIRKNNGHKANAELPKKHFRPLMKRRNTLDGKQYEKFNFGTLKKARTSKDNDDQPSNIPLITDNDEVKLDEITRIKVEKSIPQDVPFDTSTKQESDDNCDLATELGESFNLGSELDDILLENYQNATENLNDDWLTSFFT